MAVTVPCGFCDDSTRASCPYCEGTGQLPVNDDGYAPEEDEDYGASRIFG